MSYTAFTKRKTTPARSGTTAAGTKIKPPTLLDYPIDTNITSLIINDQLISDELAEAIINGKIIETTAGAGSLELDVQDRSRTLIKGLLKDWMKVGPAPVLTTHIRGQRRRVPLRSNWNDVYCTLDERDFALAGVDKRGDAFNLTFENRAVHELRRYSKPRAWTRTDTFTRAMAIKSMCDEVKTLPGGIQFHSTDLHKLQPIASTKQLPSAHEIKATKGRGFAPNAPVTVKGQRATVQQRGYISQVLQTGESMKMPYPVMVSAIMCITQESDVSILNNPYTGMGLFSQEKYINGVRSSWPAMDQGIPGDARAYFNSAIASYRQNPSQSLTALVQSVQHSGYPGAYAQWEKEAKHTLTLWGTSETGGSISFVEYNKFVFTRGQNGKREDSWTCMQRLAQEVTRRCFMVDNTCYYESDNTLVESIPYDTISEATEGIDTIDYNVDTGKTVSECTVTAHIDRWQAPPGVCVVVEGEGPIDGRWIVYQVDRPLFSNIAEITLHLPQQQLPEPAPTTHQVTLKGVKYAANTGNKIVDAVYAKAKEISQKGYPYVFAGGHGADFAPSGGPPAGYDCSGYVSACLHAAGILDAPQASGGLLAWGQAGQGKLMTIWTNPNPGASGHVYIEFKLPAPIGHVQANTSHSGYRVGVGAALLGWDQAPNGKNDTQSSLFHPRHWPGT